VSLLPKSGRLTLRNRLLLDHPDSTAASAMSMDDRVREGLIVRGTRQETHFSLTRESAPDDFGGAQ
jgi:hypothetical protein